MIDKVLDWLTDNGLEWCIGSSFLTLLVAWPLGHPRIAMWVASGWMLAFIGFMIADAIRTVLRGVWRFIRRD